MKFSSNIERDKFIEANMKLVKNRMLKLNRGSFDDDLLQEGAVALITATDRFDESQGNCFSTYAVAYIDGYILSYKCRRNYTIRPPRSGSKAAASWQKFTDSLDKVVEDDITLGEVICGDIDMEKEITGNIYAEEFVSSLNESERRILSLALQEITQKNIAKVIGSSQAHVSRMLKRIGKKYRQYEFMALPHICVSVN